MWKGVTEKLKTLADEITAPYLEDDFGEKSAERGQHTSQETTYPQQTGMRGESTPGYNTRRDTANYDSKGAHYAPRSNDSVNDKSASISSAKEHEGSERRASAEFSTIAPQRTGTYLRINTPSSHVASRDAGAMRVSSTSTGELESLKLARSVPVGVSNHSMGDSKSSETLVPAASIPLQHQSQVNPPLEGNVPTSSVRTGDGSDRSQQHSCTHVGENMERGDAHLISALRQKISAYEKEKKNMEHSILKYQDEVQQSHKETVAFYEAQCAELRSELERCKKIANEYKDLRVKHLSLKEEADTLARKVRDLRKELVTQEQEKVIPTNEALKALQQQYADLQIDNRELRDRCSTLEQLQERKDEGESSEGPPRLEDGEVARLECIIKAQNEELRKLREGVPSQSSSLEPPPSKIDASPGYYQELETKCQAAANQVRVLEAQVETLQQKLCAEKETQQKSYTENNRTESTSGGVAEIGNEKNTKCLKMLQELEESIVGNSSKENLLASIKQVKVCLADIQPEKVTSNVEQKWQEEKIGMEKKMEELSASFEVRLSQQSEELQVKLQETQKALEAALQQSQGKTQELQETAAALSQAIQEQELLQERFDDARRSLSKMKESHSAELARLSSCNVSIVSLTTTKRELEAALEGVRELLRRVQRTIVDCLTKHSDVDFSHHLAPASQDDPNAAGYLLMDLVNLLTSEFARMTTEAQQLARTQAEWEVTYERAREVNNALNQQHSDAWGLIGKLREEVSVKEQKMAQLEEKLHGTVNQLHDAEDRITTLVNELHATQEECEVWAMKMQENSSSVEGQQSKLTSLQNTIERLQLALQERDNELATALRSVSNLQTVINTFRENKTQDVEEHTLLLSAEIETLKEQLLHTQQIQKGHDAEMEQLRAQHCREMASKSLEVGALHGKLAEMRATLEKTAKQLNGETTIDKRVISHILVNFVHAFVARKREADEVLKVLSSLLSWDETIQERIGLLPGPLNPRPDQRQAGNRRGILSRIWRNDGSNDHNNGKGAESGENKSDKESQQKQSSLAELWVQFLLKESEINLSEGEPAQVVEKGSAIARSDEKNMRGGDVATSNAEKPAECSVSGTL